MAAAAGESLSKGALSGQGGQRACTILV